MTDDNIDASTFDQVIPREGSSSLKWEKYAGEDVLPMWVADMDFAIAPPIMRALQQRLEHPILGYTKAPDSLREAIVEHMQREFDWQVEPDWLVFLPGVVAGLAASCRAYAEDGAEVMINPPIYHHFFDVHTTGRHKLVQVPLHKQQGRWTYNLDAMAQAAKSEKMSLLLMCSPHNPVGTVFTEAELKAVGDMCERNNMLLVSDEIHCDLVLDKSVSHIPTAKACPEHANRIVTLMSTSKTFNLAGLNTSFAIISDAGLRERFSAACAGTVPGLGPMAMVAGEAALRDGGPWRAALLDYLADNFRLIESSIGKIPGLSLDPLQATYLAWIDASALGLNDTCGFFEKHGVGMSGGEQFGQPHYLRLNFGCQRSVLEEALKRIASAVESLNKV